MQVLLNYNSHGKKTTGFNRLQFLVGQQKRNHSIFKSTMSILQMGVRGLEAKAKNCFLFRKRLSYVRQFRQITPFYVNHERDSGDEPRVARGFASSRLIFFCNFLEKQLF